MGKPLVHTTLPRMANNHLLFVLTVPMTIIFLMAASMKIGANWMMIMGFDGYGYPIAFMFFLGYAEVFGAISLWIKRWALLGAMGLSVILLGASLTHMISNDPIALAGMAYAMTPVMLLIAFYHWRAARQEADTATNESTVLSARKG